jgi:carbamoyl-phosphate synthase large subunit
VHAHGASNEQVHESAKYDPWFIEQLRCLIDTEERVRQHGLPTDAENMRLLKSMGFSDARLAELSRKAEDKVRKARHKLGVTPVYKRIDTCAAEFASPTAYMYSTYETGIADSDDGNEAQVSDREKVVILGGGPNRIGQGIEFDYCCCHAAFALADAGYESIMVNCNPETVSTDYDTSDRLYFEPLTAEDVLEILHTEQTNGTLKGVIVQFGGQTPLKLAEALEADGIPILGTSPDAIDLAEDRDRFAKLLKKVKVAQPAMALPSPAPKRSGSPRRLATRSSSARPTCWVAAPWKSCATAKASSATSTKPWSSPASSPVLIDSYLSDAIEVDVDALCDGTDVFVAGIMEHIEQAGIHSGDSPARCRPTR